jgi:hypothetical protein
MRNIFSLVDEKVHQYQRKFQALQADFQNYSTLHTQIVVTRILDTVLDKCVCDTPRYTCH